MAKQRLVDLPLGVSSEVMTALYNSLRYSHHRDEAAAAERCESKVAWSMLTSDLASATRNFLPYTDWTSEPSIIKEILDG